MLDISAMSRPLPQLLAALGSLRAVHCAEGLPTLATEKLACLHDKKAVGMASGGIAVTLTTVLLSTWLSHANASRASVT